MVFALRESFVRNEQARRETDQAIRILPETEKTGDKKTNHWESR